jgi:hypothetical protein
MQNECVDSNQKAVAMLHGGDHDQALASFRRALVVVQQCVKSAGPEERLGMPCRPSHTQSLLPIIEEEDTENEIGGEINNLIFSVALGDSESAESQAAAAPGNLFSFYNHAFVVSALPKSLFTRTSRQENDHYSMLSSVLLFNMAVTFHKKGLAHGPNSSNNLRKALQLYFVATALLAYQDGFQALYVIQRASWNNMGHIYSHFSEQEGAMQCQVYLDESLLAESASSLRTD